MIIKGKVLNSDGPSRELLDAANAAVNAKIAEINELNKQTELLQQQRVACGTSVTCKLSNDSAQSQIALKVSVAVNELNALKTQAATEQASYDAAIKAYKETNPGYIAAAAAASAVIEEAKSKKGMYIIIGVAVLIAILVFVYFKFIKK